MKERGGGRGGVGYKRRPFSHGASCCLRVERRFYFSFNNVNRIIFCFTYVHAHTHTCTHYVLIFFLLLSTSLSIESLFFCGRGRERKREERKETREEKYRFIYIYVESFLNCRVSSIVNIYTYKISIWRSKNFFSFSFFLPPFSFFFFQQNQLTRDMTLGKTKMMTKILTTSATMTFLFPKIFHAFYVQKKERNRLFCLFYLRVN